MIDIARRRSLIGVGEPLAPGIVRIPYIRTYKTYYVDLNIIGYFKFVVDAQIISTDYGCYCGRYGDNKNRFGMRKSGKTWGFGLGDSATYIEIGQADTNRHIFTLDPFTKTCSVDNLSAQINHNFGSNQRHAIFGGYNSATIENPADAIGYEIIVYNQNKTIRHQFIPCVRLSDEKEGFWHIDNNSMSEYFAPLTLIK